MNLNRFFVTRRLGFSTRLRIFAPNASTELTILTAATIIRRKAPLARFLCIAFRLAGKAQPNARQRLAPGFGNLFPAFFTVDKALPLRKPPAHSRGFILQGCADLIIHRVVIRPSARHEISFRSPFSVAARNVASPCSLRRHVRARDGFVRYSRRVQANMTG